jgi:hypothetical protein
MLVQVFIYFIINGEHRPYSKDLNSRVLSFDEFHGYDSSFDRNMNGTPVLGPFDDGNRYGYTSICDCDPRLVKNGGEDYV